MDEKNQSWPVVAISKSGVTYQYKLGDTRTNVWRRNGDGPWKVWYYLGQQVPDQITHADFASIVQHIRWYVTEEGFGAVLPVEELPVPDDPAPPRALAAESELKYLQDKIDSIKVSLAFAEEEYAKLKEKAEGPVARHGADRFRLGPGGYSVERSMAGTWQFAYPGSLIRALAPLFPEFNLTDKPNAWVIFESEGEYSSFGDFGEAQKVADKIRQKDMTDPAIVYACYKVYVGKEKA